LGHREGRYFIERNITGWQNRRSIAASPHKIVFRREILLRSRESARSNKIGFEDQRDWGFNTISR
jgi:hypothetical protein